MHVPARAAAAPGATQSAIMRQMLEEMIIIPYKDKRKQVSQIGTELTPSATIWRWGVFWHRTRIQITGYTQDPWAGRKAVLMSDERF
jgi:hypothetical protein